MSQTTLKHGSKGEAVTQLQALLNQADHPLSIDGWFGDATEAAVRAYQAAQTPPLITDGIAGAQTHAALRGQRSPKMLSQTAIEEAAALLGVEAAAKGMLLYKFPGPFPNSNAGGSGFVSLVILDCFHPVRKG